MCQRKQTTFGHTSDSRVCGPRVSNGTRRELSDSISILRKFLAKRQEHRSPSHGTAQDFSLVYPTHTVRNALSHKAQWWNRKFQHMHAVSREPSWCGHSQQPPILVRLDDAKNASTRSSRRRRSPPTSLPLFPTSRTAPCRRVQETPSRTPTCVPDQNTFASQWPLRNQRPPRRPLRSFPTLPPSITPPPQQLTSRTSLAAPPPLTPFSFNTPTIHLATTPHSHHRSQPPSQS